MPPGISFRASALRSIWSGASTCCRSLIVPVIAFVLPASQDIIAFLTRRPRPWLFVLAGFTLLIILLDLGERNVVGFGYFNF